MTTGVDKIRFGMSPKMMSNRGEVICFEIKKIQRKGKFQFHWRYLDWKTIAKKWIIWNYETVKNSLVGSGNYRCACWNIHVRNWVRQIVVVHRHTPSTESMMLSFRSLYGSSCVTGINFELLLILFVFAFSSVIETIFFYLLNNNTKQKKEISCGRRKKETYFTNAFRWHILTLWHALNWLFFSLLFKFVGLKR